MIQKFCDFFKRPASLPVSVFCIFISLFGMFMQRYYFMGCFCGFSLGIWFGIFADAFDALCKNGKEVQQDG